MTEDFFSWLPVLLIESEEDEREHDDHHQHCRSGDAEAGLSQEEDRNTRCRSQRKADELPLCQVEKDLVFDFGQVFRDRYIGHSSP